MRSAFVLALVFASGLVVLGYFHTRAAGAREQALRAEARARQVAEELREREAETEPAGSTEVVAPTTGESRKAVLTSADRIARLLSDLDAIIRLAEEEGPDQSAARRGLAQVRARLDELDERARRAHRLAQEAEWKRSRASYEVAEGWVEDALQLGDATQRTAAIETIRAALLSGDPEQELAALRALRQLGDLEFDKSSFRAPLLQIAGDAEGESLVAALYALSTTDRRPEDIELALRAVDDPEAYTSALHLAVVFNDGDLTGEVGAAVLPLLDESHGGDVDRYLNGLSGARVSPEIEARLLEMASEDDRERRHKAIYFGLSTLQDKSPAVVTGLIETLGSDDQNAARALWGLGRGVPEASRQTVSKAMQDYFEARTSAHTRKSALRLVSMYGDAGDLPWLQALRDNPNASQEMRDAAAGAIESILSR